MGRKWRIAITTVVVIALLGWGAKVYLIDTAPLPETSNYEIDIDRVRHMARANGVPLPTHVNVTVVAESEVPFAAIRAGAPFEPHRMVRTAYQVVYPDGHIVIDAGMDRAMHEEFSAGMPYHPERYANVLDALETAKAIVVTHEHPDHIGGVARHPHFDGILPQLILTAEQVSDESVNRDLGFPENFLDRLEPVSYDDYHVVAPGLVLIKAAGHTPGNQMVYVTLDDGEEYLFVGDTAWHMSNLTMERGRPRFVTMFYVTSEEREPVLHQQKALAELHESEPGLHFVVSHDKEQLERHLDAGILKEGFDGIEQASFLD